MTNTVEKMINAEVKEIKKLGDGVHLTILAFVAINLVVSLIQLFGGSSVEAIEAMKVGGKENYELVKQIYREPAFQQQQKQQIEMALQQVKSLPAPATQKGTAVDATDKQPAAQPTTSQSEFPGGVLTKDQIATVVKGYTKGSPKARIAIIEYSDLECPFCKRHHDAGTLQKVMDTFGGDVSVTFKHFPLPFHPNAQKAAEGAECVGRKLGAAGFYNYVDQIFSSANTSLDNVKSVAAGLGVTDIESCLTTNQTTSIVQSSLDEGRTLFNVSGTPANVIIDTQSGEWIVIAGAYPFENFEKEIRRMLNK